MTCDEVLTMEPGRELDERVAEKVMGWSGKMNMNVIAEVLDLSKPVSDCPECGGLGEIGSLGSRRKCECLYIRLKTLKRELDRRDGLISELSKERNRLFERLKDITSTLGGVTFTDERQWGAYNALCDIVKDWQK